MGGDVLTTHDTDNMPWIKLWRCTRCGKWSHAQRKPKRHERAVESPGPEDELVPGKDPMFNIGSENDEPYWVWCGPFEAWRAVREVDVP
jgi:hypothetical protein